jgi:hypothetical protein
MTVTRTQRSKVGRHSKVVKQSFSSVAPGGLEIGGMIGLQHGMNRMALAPNRGQAMIRGGARAAPVECHYGGCLRVTGLEAGASTKIFIHPDDRARMQGMLQRGVKVRYTVPPVPMAASPTRSLSRPLFSPCASTNLL